MGYFFSLQYIPTTLFPVSNYTVSFPRRNSLPDRKYTFPFLIDMACAAECFFPKVKVLLLIKKSLIPFIGSKLSLCLSINCFDKVTKTTIFSISLLYKRELLYKILMCPHLFLDFRKSRPALVVRIKNIWTDVFYDKTQDNHLTPACHYNEMITFRSWMYNFYDVD